jgi:hypothetical protein
VVGDHGGGVNLVGGCSGRPVHGEVVDTRGGEVAGEANGCNKRGEKVCRARGEVAELKSYTNLTGLVSVIMVRRWGGRWPAANAPIA